jgi:O-antigen ligase
MIYLLIIICLGLYAWLAFKNIRAAICLLLLCLPAYLLRFQILGLPTTILEGFLLIAFAVWYLKTGQSKALFKKTGRRLPYPFGWEMIAVVIAAFIAAGISGFNTSALGIWKAYFFEPILFFILVINNFKSRKDWFRLIWPLAFSALVISIIAVWQKFTGDLILNPFWADAASRRVVSVYGYPNAVGLYLAPIVMLLCSLLLHRFRFTSGARRWRESVFLSLVVFLSLAAIVFARSRGALLGIVIGSALWLALYDKITRKILLGSLIVMAAAGLLIPSARSKIIDEIKFPDKSIQIRLEQWTETWAMLSNNHRWLTGAGLDNYQAAVAPYHKAGIFIKTSDPNWEHGVKYDAAYRQKAWQPLEIYMYPHNIFLNFWSELGLLGLLLFLWIITKFYVWGFQLQSRLNKLNSYGSRLLVLGLMGAMTASIVQGLMDVPYFKNDLALLFWLLIAGISALRYDYFKQKPLKK